MKFIPVLLIVLISGCSFFNDYRDVSAFTMRADALKAGEPLNVIYANDAPVNTDPDYYLQVIVVSQETGDTVNVLTTLNSGFIGTVRDSTYNFIAADDFINKIKLSDMEHLNNESIKEIETREVEVFTKVLRHPAYDYIEQNHFPTIIGGIGKVFNTDTIQ